MNAEGANAGQIAFWNGKAGEKWTINQDAQDRMHAGLAERSMAAANFQPGERVIDVGCGCGTSTLEIAGTVGSGGSVIGIDISRPMLGRARDRAEALPAPNASFIAADASLHPFAAGEADVVYSRFGIMFFANAGEAFANFARALRPGGRIVFVCWRRFEDNEWVRVPHAAACRLTPIPPPWSPGKPGPFAFGDDTVIGDLLGDAGFRNIAIEPFDGPLWLADTAEAGVRKIAQTSPLSGALAEIDRDLRHRVMDEIGQAMAPFAGPDGGMMGGSAWIVTARR